MRRIPVFLIMILICILPVNAHASGSDSRVLLSNVNLKGSQQVERFNFLLSQQTDLDSTKLQALASLKLKDPSMAVFYSVIPGVVLHGSGHIYAGKIGTGITLFGIELVGLGLTFAEVLSNLDENDSGGDDGTTASSIGMILFLGSWVYDLVESPFVVKRQNEKLLLQNQTGVEFRINDEQPKVVVVWRF